MEILLARMKGICPSGFSYLSEFNRMFHVTLPAARPILGSYVQRLMHEKYAATYAKVLTTLRNMFKARADGPAPMNFIALVKWIDPEAAAKLGRDIGMTV